MAIATPEAARAPDVRGWCPGAYAPMASNDGLLIRAKIIGSRLTTAQASAVVEIAANCGNGAIDLSQRAQLQIRGVRPETLEDALRRLDTVGLLPASADAERVTNIVASPLAGLAQGAFDANEMAAALARALQADDALRALPWKFLFVIDDGGATPLDDVDGDIRIEPGQDGDIAIRVAGAPMAATLVPRDEAVATALRLARAFVALRSGNETRRMRALIDAIGLDSLLCEAGIAAREYVRPAQPRPGVYGARGHRNVFYCGVGMPFGRWLARDFAAAGELADKEGFGELRLTPWRAILVPTRDAEAASRLSILARVHGFITFDDDLRLAIAACAGAPECPQALGPTRQSISRIAALAQDLAGPDGVGLHISGCAKGCARAGVSPVTLVVKEDGYDIIDNGRASDPPSTHVTDLESLVQALAARAVEKTA